MIASEKPPSVVELVSEPRLPVVAEEPPPAPARQPGSFRAVVLVLFAAALAGTAGAFAGGSFLQDPVLYDAGVTLLIAAGMLGGVALARAKRQARPASEGAGAIRLSLVVELGAESRPEPEAKAEPEIATAESQPSAAASFVSSLASRLVSGTRSRIRKHFQRLKTDLLRVRLLPAIALVTATAGFLAILHILRLQLFETGFFNWTAGIAAGVCLAAAGLAGVVVHYLSHLEPEQMPEAEDLCRGARAAGWILVLAAVSVGLEWANQRTAVHILHYTLLLINGAICIGLVRVGWREREAMETFPPDLSLIRALGSRNNVVGSVLDSAERVLGIDLRSTWALTVVRTSVEPLVIGLCLLGWLSTSVTVVGLQEEGLVERLGVPVGGQALQPGLHVHFPWPVDRVQRLPILQIQSLTVGHEGEEEGGPENVLWARQHAANEYTLLLGNGRDLVTIDASVAYRITDPRAWRYHTQNSADALKAIAYRAVMRNTVNKTLADALSENMATLTADMRAMIQREADALGLGVKVEAFTVGGMHPPVPVSPAYQAVVSAELGKGTAIIDAQAFRNRTVPSAEADVIVSINSAQALAAQGLATAAGQAWSFRTLESQFHAAPEEYRFRSRLEALEKGLEGRSFTVVDSRFQRDGGELWLTQ